MNATRKVKLKDITSNLTCQLCQGYFIDATTIIECLHSFCKSCIVKHLEKSEYCPVCDVQLHSTKPLSSIRSDQMLQEIVYKLVPGLFRREMSRRREFYGNHTESSPTSQMDSGQVFNELYITSDDIIHLSLQYFTDDPTFKNNSTRYLKCPAAVSISILKKLVQGKFDLNHEVDIDVMYGERILPDEFLLMDIAYKYSWTSNGSKPLQLSYRVRKPPSPIQPNVQPSKLSTPVSTKTATPSQIKRRKSRESTDTDVTRSEILKSSNRNLPVGIDVKPQISPITPKLTPNGKMRGRRKRLTEDGGKTPVQNKKKKGGKNSSPVKDYKEMESQSEPTLSKPAETGIGPEKEVQLRISENGVISATSVFSGEEKIINLLKTPPKANGLSTSTPTPYMKSDSENHLLKNIKTDTSTNSNEDVSNTGTVAVTSPSNPGLVHPLLISNPVGMSRPNYVKLNIPVVPTSTVVQSPTNNNNTKMVPNGINHINVSPNINKVPTSLSSPPKLTAVKRKLLDKVLNGSNSKSQNGPTGLNVKPPTEFEDKQANVKKALIDLEKKLYTTISKGNLSKLPGMLGMSTSNNQKLETTGQTTGVTLPLHLNGSQNALSFPLTFGTSGMTLNLISSTTSCPSAMGSITSPLSVSQQPQKKYTHQATVVNGDLKFSPSPRHILPSPSKDGKQPSSTLLSPKKPPKFFKSRHSSSNITGTTPTSSDSESPVKKDANLTKSVSANGNISHNFSFGSTATASKSSPCSIGANTITTPSGNSHLQNQSRIQSQVSNPFNPLNNLQLNQLQMNLAAAAAASSANNIPMTLVPFVTSNYCSMPFMNSRSPFNMNMNLISSQLPNFPFGYQGMINPTFTQSQPYNPPKNSLNGTINGSHNFTIPLAPISPKAPHTSDAETKGQGSLDLSMNKSNGKQSRNTPNGSPQAQPLSLKMSTKLPVPKASPKKAEKFSNKMDKVPTTPEKGPISLLTKMTNEKSIPQPSKAITSSIFGGSINGNGIHENEQETIILNPTQQPNIETANIQVRSNGTVESNSDSIISPSSNDESSPAQKTKMDSCTTANHPDEMVTKKLQNGHPDYAQIPSPKPILNTDDTVQTLESSTSSNLETPCKIPLCEEVKVDNGTDQTKISNGNLATATSIVDSPIKCVSLTKDQIPSCNNNNNNNGPPDIPQASSTTGA